MIMPFSLLFYRKGTKYAPPYMAGRPVEGHMQFAGSMGVSRELVLSNYYLTSLFGEERLFMVGTALCWALLLFAAILLVGVIL